MIFYKISKWAQDFKGYLDKRSFASEKEKAFAYSYLSCFNVKKAAQNAGYPLEECESIGRKLILKRSVIGEILRIRQIKAVVLEACQTEIAEKYLQIAFSDVRDFQNISQLAIDGNKINIKAEDRIKALEALSFIYKLKEDNKKTDEKIEEDLKIEIIKGGRDYDEEDKD